MSPSFGRFRRSNVRLSEPLQQLLRAAETYVSASTAAPGFAPDQDIIHAALLIVKDGPRMTMTPIDLDSQRSAVIHGVLPLTIILAGPLLAAGFLSPGCVRGLRDGSDIAPLGDCVFVVGVDTDGGEAPCRSPYATLATANPSP